MPYTEAALLVQQSIAARTKVLIIVGVIMVTLLMGFIVFSGYNLLRINENSETITALSKEDRCQDIRDDDLLVAVSELIGDSRDDGQISDAAFDKLEEKADNVRALYIDPETGEPYPEGEGPCDF